MPNSQLTARQLQQTVGGRLVAHSPASDRATSGRIVIDSREVQPGDVFWGLPGRTHDGASFAADALAKGAAGAVVGCRPDQPAAGGWILVVDDPVGALERLARAQRERFRGSVIAVTGSVGKTTTREMIHQVLGSSLTGIASPRNFNNELGLPLCMAALDAASDYAVFELGARRAGQITQLARLCRPRIGVISAIGDAHLAGFGSRAAIAEAKCELLAALDDDGWAVLDGDEPLLRRRTGQLCQRVIWVGRGSDCDVVATHIWATAGRLAFRVGSTRFEVPVWGRHHLTAALAAVAVGQLHGLSLTAIAHALARFRPAAMRCQLVDCGGVQVINDAYNASPASMRAALDVLRDFPTDGRRICVCGDMRELGPQAHQLHYALGVDVVTRCGADLLVACGEFAAQVIAGARAAGMPARAMAAEPAVPLAAARLRQWIEPGDVVLVKGSRDLALERVIDVLSGADGRRARRQPADQTRQLQEPVAPNMN